MPDVKANIWLADELNPHEQSWTKTEGRRSPQAPSQRQAKGRQLKRKDQKKRSLRWHSRRIRDIPAPIQRQPAPTTRNSQRKSPLTKSALSYMTCHPSTRCVAARWLRPPIHRAVFAKDEHPDIKKTERKSVSCLRAQERQTCHHPISTVRRLHRCKRPTLLSDEDASLPDGRSLLPNTRTLDF